MRSTLLMFDKSDAGLLPVQMGNAPTPPSWLGWTS